MKYKQLSMKLNGTSTKVQHLVDALAQAIEQGVYQPGEALPSVNQISREYTLSRDTVFKAYQELKQRNLVDSTPAKGYHVMEALTKVLLILDVYSPFKDVLYNSIVNNLPRNYKVDLVFHFYNERIFESVIFDSVGRYSYYIIMNFSTEYLHDSIRKIETSRLLLLDLGDFDKGAYSYVCQDFGQSVYDSLMTGINQIKRYSEFILCLPEESEHPKVLTRYFRKFCKDNNLNGHVIKKVTDIEPSKGQLWLLIQQKDLVEIVKKCRLKSLRSGEDVGLLAYNDTPMYEIIEGGISAISTDFALMGCKAAEFILTRKKITENIPARLIIRGSI